MEQRSPEWFAMRAGKITGSAFDDVMNVLKSGEAGAARKNLIVRLAIERLTGECVESFQNDAMRRGAELEPEARAAYEAQTGELVESVAFLAHPSLPFVGVSPDGLVDGGLVEFKCPASMHKHLDALQNGAHAIEYRWQLQGQMWVCGRPWVDAVSYDPRFPAGLRLAITRVSRDDIAIAKLEAECRAVNTEVSAALEQLNSIRNAA